GVSDRIALTGGCGFIGSHVAEALASAGFRVLIIDDLSHPCGVEPPPEAEVLIADAGSPRAATALTAFRPDTVVHLAARGGVARALRDPAAHARTVLASSVALMSSALAAGARSVVAASSGGALYGEAARLPADETLHPAPRSAYGAEKFAEEGYLAALGRTAGVRTLALRFGNVYGPRQDGSGEAGVVAITCHRLLAGQAPIVFGDGGQTRDFVYVADVAAAVLAAIDSDAAGALNVGTGREASVGTVVGLLARQAGHIAPVERHEARPGEVRRACLDIGAIRHHLGWQPAVALEEGIARTWTWFSHRPNVHDSDLDKETA
ncbi:MAG TPA: NAD-dependent epimerase/dehydratase family protein, partial [Candidatus Dormibacteraeota bacterium]|nr:NAD-dependent epimerase/dehydratase family protein [Candidatus Dormibacteraeota bacterium]